MRFNDPTDLAEIVYYKASDTSSTTRTLAGDDLFDDDFGVGDYVLFRAGGNQNRRDLFLTLSSGISATSYTGVWEFSPNNGSYWETMTEATDGTSDLSTSGDLTYDVKDYNYHNTFCIRYRITAVDTPTEGGAYTSAKCGDNTLYVENADDTTFLDMFYENVSEGWNCMNRPQGRYAYDRRRAIYTINCRLVIESGGRLYDSLWVNAIWDIYGGNNVSVTNTVEVGGELQLGNLDGGGFGYQFCDLSATYGNRHPNAGSFFANYGDLKLYGSRIYIAWTISGTLDGRNCMLEGVNAFNATVNPSSVDIVISSTGRGWLEFAAANKTWYNIKYHGFTSFGTQRANGKWYNCEWLSGWSLRNDNGNKTFTFVGCSPKPEYINFRNPGERFYWKHLVNVKVKDLAGNLINGATVVCKDVDGTTVFTETTDATGMIPEQEVIETQFTDDIYTYTNIYEVDWDRRTPHTFEISASGGLVATISDVDINADYSEDSPLIATVLPEEPVTGISTAYVS